MIDISSDRLAVFNYAHVPWLKKHQVRIEPDDLPAADVRIELLRMTIEIWPRSVVLTSIPPGTSRSVREQQCLPRRVAGASPWPVNISN